MYKEESTKLFLRLINQVDCKRNAKQFTIYSVFDKE